MGAKVSNPKNQLLQEQAEEVIEYEGYEEFPIIEVAKNIVMKNDKVRPNPSLNNHSGGSSIGKYESENYLNKYKDKLRYMSALHLSLEIKKFIMTINKCFISTSSSIKILLGSLHFLFKGK